MDTNNKTVKELNELLYEKMEREQEEYKQSLVDMEPPEILKRVRKYGAFCTGITQNVDDLLQSHTARTMLANSEFIVMLNQASTDRLELAKLLNISDTQLSTDRVQLAELMGISDTQLSHITNVEAGCGLMKVGSALVPFINKFPHDTKLYRLMTTKPGETV